MTHKYERREGKRMTAEAVAEAALPLASPLEPPSPHKYSNETPAPILCSYCNSFCDSIICDRCQSYFDDLYDNDYGEEGNTPTLEDLVNDDNLPDIFANDYGEEDESADHS